MKALRTFDTLGDEANVGYYHSKPFWTIPYDKDDKATLDWFDKAITAMGQESAQRTEKQIDNLRAYRNYQGRGRTRTRTNDSDSNNTLGKMPRLQINYIYDMVEQHVAKLTKFRPSVSITPEDDEEYTDKIDAQVAEEIQDALWYRLDTDKLLRRLHKGKKIFGEYYVLRYFNKDLGELHPDYVAEQKAQGVDTPRIPLVDDDGNPVKGTDGKELFIQKPVRIGDIDSRFYMPWNVFSHPAILEEEIEWRLFRHYEPVEDLKAEYPDLSHKIKAGGFDSQRYSNDSLDIEEYDEDVEVWIFYHKSTKQISEGRYIKFTKDVILENTVNRYKLFDKSEIPCIKAVDVEIPGLQHGASSLENAKPVSDMVQRLTSMIVRNQIMLAHPKWFMQKGACKIESLGNDATIVQYVGSPPVLAQANPTPREVFEFRDKLKEEMFQFEGLYPTSRGEPPPGIKAFVALQFMDEQENDRANASVAEHNSIIRKIAMWDVSIAGTFYDDSEKELRLKRILGANKARQIPKDWSFGNLTKPFGYKVQNASALPQQRSARTQYIMDISERWPNLVNEEQVADVLDLGQSKKFMNIATVNIRSSDAENDQILRTGKTTPPELWEDHVKHYNVHVKLLSEKSCKDSLPPERRQELIDHIMAHEMFMTQISKNNPAYMQMILAQFPSFPMFFTVPMAPVTPLPPMPMQQPSMPMEGLPQPELPQQEMQAEEIGMPPDLGLSMPPGAENVSQTPNVGSLIEQSTEG
jgi:hypothetical protein